MNDTPTPLRRAAFATAHERPEAPRPKPGSYIARNPALVPALFGVGVLLIWAASEGGFPQSTWLPGALVLAAVLAVALIALPRQTVLPRPVVVAVGLLFAYAAWSYASIAWAAQKGDALDGAGRTLLYAIVFALFACWPLRRRAGATVLGALGLGVALIGAVELLRMNAAADPSGYFIFARLSEPVGYQNANVALWFMAFIPCALLAARTESGPILRGVSTAAATLLLGLALAGQSRGWVFAAPVSLVVLVALAPDRTRIGAVLALVGLAALLYVRPVLDLAKVNDPARDPAALVSSAARAVFFATILAGVVGGALAWLDWRRPPSPARLRTAGVGLAGLLAVAALTGVVAAFALDDPLDRISQAREDFVEKGSPKVEPGESRFASSLGSDRYDFWQVALDGWKDRPLQGIGADNFQQLYLREGEAEELARYPHSVEVRTLTQTGLVGVALLGGAFIAALLAAWQGLRRERELSAAVAAAALGVVAYWLAHGSVDWFWEFPVLGGAAFAMLGLAAAAAPRTPLELPAAGRPYALGRARVAAVGVLLAAALVLFGAPWLSYRYIDRASAEWPTDPRAAFTDLDRAASLNPVSSRPDLVAGTIALRLGDIPAARERFEAARERDAGSAFVHLELGAIASAGGDRARALTELREAARLQPRDELTADALRTVQEGGQVDLAALNDSFVERAEGRLGRR